MMDEVKYKYNGAKALVALHEIQIKSFYDTWREAKKLNINLPKTDDPDYKSLDTLLYHVLRAARGYMVWICNNLELNDPQINKTPTSDFIENQAETYISHLLEKWQLPLVNIEPELFDKVFKSNWGIEYCIDAMLEHAVMHPIRHEFQLINLIQKKYK
jgi:hypothetical protein